MEEKQIVLLSELSNDVKWIKEALAKQDERYAAKWVQQIFTGGIGMILIAIIGAVLGLILISPTKAFFEMIVGS